MPDVILDGVAVQFSGPAPASVAAVHALLEQALAEQGRVLAGLWIDGQPFDDKHAGATFDSVSRIEARSVTLASALGEISAGLRPELNAIVEPGRELAHEVMRVPWTEIQPRCLQHLDHVAALMQRVVELAALTGEGSPVTHAVTALAGIVERWMQAIQSGDAAAAALLLDDELAKALHEVAKALPVPESS